MNFAFGLFNKLSEYFVPTSVKSFVTGNIYTGKTNRENILDESQLIKDIINIVCE